MSWIEKIQTNFTITCGDGKSYTPNWINASKGVEYNISVFEFIGVSGSLVRRKLPKGRKYAIEILFQGENNIEQSEAFGVSADNPEPWTIQHPLYGSLLVQPSDLVYDDTDFNVTRITGTLTETIAENVVTRAKVSVPDLIEARTELVEQQLAIAAANNIPNIGTKETRSLLSSMSGIYKSVSTYIKSNEDAANFLNAYNKANAYINNGFYSTIETLGTIHDFVSQPFKFQQTLINRLQMFVDQYNLLTKSVDSLFTQQSKNLYQHNAGLSITGLIMTSITDIENAYKNADDVFNVINIILDTYNGFMSVLDELQTDNGGDTNSFIPDADAITMLSQLVGLALSSLVDISSNSRQKRTIYLQEDSNVILVAKKIYGLLPDDSTLDALISTNNIGLNEILGLKKGRKIIYYV